MSQAVVISRFPLTPEELVKAGAMFHNFTMMVSQCVGYQATSVWRSTTDADQFLRTTTFDSIENYLRAYDKMAATGGLERAILRYGVLPDVQIFSVNWTHGRSMANALDHEFLSLSDRNMVTDSDAEAWVEKLKSNLRECDAIPGFDGCLLGTGYELPQRVLGLALWRSEVAFRESVPKSPDYPIPFYQRVK